VMTIMIFGQLAEITGGHTVVTEQFADTDSLGQWLHRQYPALAQAKYALAVNKSIVHHNTPLTNGAELALLPPFSGG
jgi:sulfur-carrier protein